MTNVIENVPPRCSPKNVVTWKRGGAGERRKKKKGTQVRTEGTNAVEGGGGERTRGPLGGRGLGTNADARTRKTLKKMF